jgi:hypothetical protein
MSIMDNRWGALFLDEIETLSLGAERGAGAVRLRRLAHLGLGILRISAERYLVPRRRACYTLSNPSRLTQ